ncbi:hypothetical protein Y032_0201g1717 [Ancylostoma ceylanicum]|uniref:Uncharacterized protein n=1 Tax=Ancylostoma ceylanicum TaxID=53326 RepID=A0A016SM85_9BILA|nr:hypothetical protein Y032_0201g1717 [Ancylostoma ceylanicum]
MTAIRCADRSKNLADGPKKPPQGFHTFDASGKKKGGEKRAGNLNNRLVISAKKSTWEYKSHYEWLLRRSVLSL